MTGISTIRLYQRLELECRALGLEITASRYYGSADPGILAVRPADDGLPPYARDTQLFTGSLEQLEYWLAGVTWAREYDRVLKISSPKSRERSEQDFRNRHLVRVLATTGKTDS